MKVALVPDYLAEYGGAERTFEIFCEMFPNAKVFTLLYDPSKMPDVIQKMDIQVSSLQKKFILKVGRKLFGPEAIVRYAPVAIEQFDLSDFDLVISAGSFAKGALTRPETPHIFYCHRLMRFLWEKHEEAMSTKPKILRPYLRNLTYNLRVWDYLAADRPDYIIANSHHTQKQIKKFYGKGSEVIYPAIDLSKFKPNEKREDYYLMVTRLGPFDQVDLVIRAFNELGKQLLIIGDGKEKKRLQKMAKANIEFLGRKDPDVLAEYYAGALAFISIGEESFGLTEVEAAASGVPVIAYKKGGVQETVKPGLTGEFFNTLTVRDLVETIEFFERNQSRYQTSEIRTHAEQFDKKLFKQKINNFIDRVMIKRNNN
jgi:glycosyltransferase involved in cell wall biosynthesis